VSGVRQRSEHDARLQRIERLCRELTQAVATSQQQRRRANRLTHEVHRLIEAVERCRAPRRK
jgi:flagellar biosynthesis/type III secretory pathway chaperone